MTIAQRKSTYDDAIELVNEDGLFHSEDGPAIIFPDGTKYWYINGKLHREDGPAIEESNGTKFWYKYAKIHREDGPAIEYNDGKKLFYYNGKWINCNSTEEFVRMVKLKAFW